MLSHLWLWLGRWTAAKGLTSVAESCYRHAGDSGNAVGAEALFALGKSQIASARLDEAIATLSEAVRMAPGYARAWCALGAAHRHAAHMPEAREAYERALALDPAYLEARTNLGEWHLVSGSAQAALEVFDAVLKREPRHYEALTNRIAALIELRRPEAERAVQDALSLYPDSAPLYVNLGSVYEQLAKGRDAAGAYRKALELDPTCEEATLSLATLLGAPDQLIKAIDFLRKQIAVRGESVDRLCRLAQALAAQKDYTEAKETCERILAKYPDHVVPLVLLGSIHGAYGEPRKSLAQSKRVVELQPELSSIRSNVLFDLNYLDGISREDVFAQHLDWAARHERPLLARPWCQRRPGDEGTSGAGRRLRVGYVSGDFVSHPVGFLLHDILRDHDKAGFEFYCYSQTVAPDWLTDRIKSYADHWCETLFMGDEALADRIVADGIDILVDLAGHTANNRLKVFAMRPAPVQVTWIGYFHSTGLSSIDYFITDPYSTPLDGGQLFSEVPVYLPHTRFCYAPPDYVPAVVELPAVHNGYITFGSFNRLQKLTEQVIRAWVRVVQGVPGSRLLLKTAGLGDPNIRASVTARFEAAGLPAERLELRGNSLHVEMFRQYGDIDIALDPFPFNGGMTTMEALWMGVPVVTVAGDTVVSRQTASALINLDMPELIFPDVDAYVAGAIALANDRERLIKLRRELRPRMARSPLCQSEQFAADLELLYRRMWGAWLRGEKLSSEIVAAPPVTKRLVLHVGCGSADRRSMPPLFQSHWNEVRLDINPDVMPDIVASMTDMSPVASASVDAVYSSHNIEHLYPHDVEVALKEFRRVLKPDGMLVLLCPDLQQVCALVAADKLEEAAYISPAGPIAPLDILYGLRSAMAAGNLFMAHKTGFTARSLTRALLASGFKTAVVEVGTCFDLWALAYPEEPSAERLAADKLACLPKKPAAS